jgi:2-C-methyl-D-erythritol 2,4-cyclodiphosphate synthase
MLVRVRNLIAEGGWRIENIDGTIVAQRPRLSPHTAAMRDTIADTLSISVDRVSVKSKTTDGLGFTGTSEGMAAYCVALLMRDDAAANS